MKLIRSLFLFGIILFPQLSQAQTFKIPSLSALEDSLEFIQNISDSDLRTDHLNSFWDSLKAHKMIPFTHEDNAVFMYRSNLNVEWNGDFNNWGNEDELTEEKLTGTDLWIAKTTFPADARLDYKIVVEGNWILDPNNPLQQWSGFGPNSELRMPDYEVPEETIIRPEIDKGTLSGNITIHSSHLNANISYKVYTPFDFAHDQEQDLPVVYVTDGHEYSDPKLGNMVTALDNLIYDQKIPPVLAVFISPIVNGTNRRMDYYVFNNSFADFVVEELIPEIEQNYKARPDPAARAIMGTSLGGLNSAFFATHYPNVFDNIVMHSPALLYEGDTQGDFEQAEDLPSNFYISTGTFYDNDYFSRELAQFLSNEGYNIKFTEVPQGHSWGNWKGLIDEPLIFFWEDFELTVSNELKKVLPENILISNYPNPFNPSTTIQVDLNAASVIDLDIYNSTGQMIQTIIGETFLPSGSHEFQVDLSGFASGLYFYKVKSSTSEYVNKMILMK